MADTVQVPGELFRKLVDATAAYNELHDALEDFLILHNPALLRRLRKARREHLSGQTRSWEEFKRDFKQLRRRKKHPPNALRTS